jgi:hypothetical protein
MRKSAAKTPHPRVLAGSSKKNPIIPIYSAHHDDLLPVAELKPLLAVSNMTGEDDMAQVKLVYAVMTMPTVAHLPAFLSADFDLTDDGNLELILTRLGSNLAGKLRLRVILLLHLMP